MSWMRGKTAIEHPLKGTGEERLLWNRISGKLSVAIHFNGQAKKTLKLCESSLIPSSFQGTSRNLTLSVSLSLFLFLPLSSVSPSLLFPTSLSRVLRVAQDVVVDGRGGQQGGASEGEELGEGEGEGRRSDGGRGWEMDRLG